MSYPEDRGCLHLSSTGSPPSDKNLSAGPFSGGDDPRKHLYGSGEVKGMEERREGRESKSLHYPASQQCGHWGFNLGTPGELCGTCISGMAPRWGGAVIFLLHLSSLTGWGPPLGGTNSLAFLSCPKGGNGHRVGSRSLRESLGGAVPGIWAAVGGNAKYWGDVDGTLTVADPCVGQIHCAHMSWTPPCHHFFKFRFTHTHTHPAGLVGQAIVPCYRWFWV